MAMESFIGCKVRIARNLNLEKLLVTRRSAKIRARRTTIAVDKSIFSSGSSADSGTSLLFKKMSSKPFTRRRSMYAEVHADSKITANISSTEENLSSSDGPAALPLNIDPGSEDVSFSCQVEFFLYRSRMNALLDINSWHLFIFDFLFVTGHTRAERKYYVDERHYAVVNKCE